MIVKSLVLCAVLGMPSVAAAQSCPVGFVCVEQADMLQFLQLAREHKCRAEKKPLVTADPVSIIVDRRGRVYGTGTGTRPYKLHLAWCNYQIDAKSQLKIQTAMHLEQEWGLRFRPKAAFGMLGRELIDGRGIIDSGDIGLMVEPFFYHWANLNGFISFRSAGIGIGLDVTANFGVATLLNTTWGTWRANLFLATYFAF